MTGRFGFPPPPPPLPEHRPAISPRTALLILGSLVALTVFVLWLSQQ